MAPPDPTPADHNHKEYGSNSLTPARDLSICMHFTDRDTATNVHNPVPYRISLMGPTVNELTWIGSGSKHAVPYKA